ncbi:MAG: hypothetical protein V1850_03655 [Candidatus Bathyarchaeota archaeon]
MDNRLYKVVVGLALENEIYNRRANKTLANLFSRPNLDDIIALHHRLIASSDHFDREVAFWLELGLEHQPIKIDLKDLLEEIDQMEVLLSDLLSRADANSQRDLNDWLNYIVNVAYSIRDGFEIDAKTLMSLAFQSSKSDSIERIKRDPSLQYQIGVLQKETFRLFEEIKRFPLKLATPEERLDSIIELQVVFIDLLQRYYLERPEKELIDIIRYPIEKLEVSQRYLMRSDVAVEKAKQEMELIVERLEWQMGNINAKKVLDLVKKIYEKVKDLSRKIS